MSAPNLLAELPPALRLALSYAPAPARQETLALLALDTRLSAAVRGRGEPIGRQLRLAWWRESLTGSSPDAVNADRVLKMLRSWHDPACLVVLPNAWEVLLAEELTQEDIAEFVTGRAQAFVCLARQLNVGQVGEVEVAAKMWVLGDLAAHLTNSAERDLVVRYAERLASPGPLPRMMRPLAVLAGLGHRALKRGGVPLLSGPACTLVALRIGLTGR